MAESTKLSATDVLSVRSRVSWAAIAAGAMIALAVYFLLTLLGAAIGLEVAMRGSGGYNIGAGAAIYSILSLLLAMFLGGWSVSRLAVGESKLEAVLYGVILWGVLFVGMFWTIGSGVRVGFGALLGMATGGMSSGAESAFAANPGAGGAFASALDGMSAQIGGDKLQQDLTKVGLEPDQAKKAQDAVNAKINDIRSGKVTIASQARDLATDPGVVDQTRKATWYTLAGIVVSMVTVILGSLVGSGDLPVPVPILGVRRAAVGPRP